MLQNKAMRCFFYSNYYAFQAQRTNMAYAMGRLKGNLYVLYSDSFNQNAN